MAPKTHRPAPGMSRHSRSASGGSSKIGLNLHFTQKEPATSQAVRKAKASERYRHESPTRPSGHPPRTNSDHHIQAKTAGHPMYSSRAVQDLSQRPHGAKSKTDFSIARAEGDDDEWVSSESGPVTPDNQSDDDEVTSPTEPPTPVELSNSNFVPAIRASEQTAINGNGNEVATTPRAGIPPPHQHLSSSCHKPPTTPPALSEEKSQPLKTGQSARTGDNLDRNRNQTMVGVQTNSKKPPAVKQVRSEVSPPPSPHHHHHTRTTSSNRHSTTRPPSLYSINSKSDVSSRPHPLIRGQSAGLGPLTTPRPLPLAPLTTLPANDSFGIGQLSSSPPAVSPLSRTSVSPAPSTRDSLAAREDHPPSEARRQLRRQSTSSSQASIATIPYHSTVSRSAHDRQRTLSTMSTSSLAALSPFAHSHRHNSPPRSPAAGFTSHFPPADETNEVSELIHSLLPPPYLSAHLTVLAHRSPIWESYDKVSKAKRQHR